MRFHSIPLLASLAVLAVTTIPAEELRISVAAPTVVEGAPLKFAIQRTGTTGALSVDYEVGAPIADVTGVSASSQTADASAVCDGRLDTQWMSAGNSDQPLEKDDAPSLTLVLAKPTQIAALRMANYVNPGHAFRGMNEVRLEVSDDGKVFKTAEVFKIRPSTDTLKVSEFQRVQLDTPVIAKVVRLVALSNHAGTTFGLGSKVEGPYSNVSFCGLAEIQLELPGIAGNDVLAGSGTVVIADGSNREFIQVLTTDDHLCEHDEPLEMRILPGTGYVTGPRGRAQAMIIDNDGGDELSITAPSPTTLEKSKKSGVFRIARKRTRGPLTVHYNTCNVPVKIASVSASDAYSANPAANAHDGKPETLWMNRGNAKLESDQIDEPWIAFTFAEPQVLGAVRITNYANPGHSMRCAREVTLLNTIVNDDDFTPLGNFTLARTDDQATSGISQTFTLPGVLARRVMLRVNSNYATVFGKGTSFEGDYANNSITGLAEVQFMTGSTAGINDVRETFDGTVIIPDGKAFVDLPVTAIDDAIKEGTEQLVVTLLPDETAYMLSLTARSAAVSITDND